MTIRTPNNSYYVSGASGGQNHTLPFGADRFEDDDLFVYVWNTSTEAWDKKTVTTHYTVSSTQVSFTSGNIPSTRVIVLRKTDVDEDFPKADFVAGASIKAQDLDNNQMQALRGIKELRDQKLSAVPSIAEDGTPSNPKMYANLDMNGYKVVNQPAGYITSTDILDGTIVTADVADSAITTAKIADSAVTTAKIAADAVNGSKIADNSINSEHYVDGSIDTAHIADAQVTTAKIAADAVTGSKLAHNSVNSEHYVTGSIDHDHIGDAQITTAKIADVNVTTAKIANDAVTTAKIADANVTTAKIADANVTTAKIADSAVTTAKIADAELVELATMGGNTASALADLTQSEVQILDGATVTTAELNILDGVTATATELNQLDGNTLKTTGTDFTSSSQFPAASEIDARITARIDPLGGFEAIANEDSFPATAPPAGTVISIANANGLAVNGSGVGAGTRAGGSDAVVINGFPSTFNSTSLDDGIGLLVIATSTAHTYDFHRVVAKNEDVRQLSSDINDFKARYRIGSSNPTTDNDAGDLFFNTGTSKMLVYNATSSAWEEVQAVGDFFINTLSSSSGTGGGSATFNGSAYRFTLSNAPTYAQQLLVSVNGVVQKPNSGTSQPSEGFAIDGGDIILAAAPATGADAFFITIGSSVGIGTPSDNTISTAKIIDGAVTSAKIADGTIVNADVNASAAIAGTKISPDFGSQNVVTTGSAAIGTSSPISDAALTLSTDSDTALFFRRGGGTNQDGAIRFAGGDFQFLNGANSSTVSGLSERLRIDSSGNVGIGTTSPNSLLDCAGGNITLTEDTNLIFKNSARSTNRGAIQFTSGGEFRVRYGSLLTEGMRIDSSGNVGIGTSSPGAKLSIEEKTYVGAGFIRFLDNASSQTGTAMWRPATDTLAFNTNSTERLRIDSSGRINIGTTSATQKVSVGTSASETIGYSVDWTGSGAGQVASFTANTSTGEVRIGATNSAGTYFPTFYSNNSERMRIDSSGNVGINTTSPGAKLDVQASNNDSIPTNADVASAGLIRIQNTNASAVFGGIGLQARSSSSAQWLIATQWTANNQGDLVLRTRNASTTSAEIGRFLNGGGITFNGDTAAANALDDYEEGTWTPQMNKSGVSGTAGTANAVHGYYRKIGKLLWVSFYWYRVSGSFGNNSSAWYVSGLPYNIATLAGSAYQFIGLGYYNLNGQNYSDNGRWQSNSTNGPDTLTLYSPNKGNNWTSGGIEFSGSGVLMIT